LHGDERPRRVLLPTYPFERARYFVEPAKPSARPARTEVEIVAAGEAVVEAAASHAAEVRSAPLEAMTYIPPGVESPARNAVAARNGSNDSNGSNGRRRREVLQAVISQQLIVSARQLEVMSEQLKLLRNGAGKNVDAGLPEGR
jgi:hypothetical protein